MNAPAPHAAALDARAAAHRAADAAAMAPAATRHAAERAAADAADAAERCLVTPPGETADAHADEAEDAATRAEAIAGLHREDDDADGSCDEPGCAARAVLAVWDADADAAAPGSFCAPHAADAVDFLAAQADDADVRTRTA